jgi:hypothetical protein
MIAAAAAAWGTGVTLNIAHRGACSLALVLPAQQEPYNLPLCVCQVI